MFSGDIDVPLRGARRTIVMERVKGIEPSS
jgi:hypothetical protein